MDYIEAANRDQSILFPGSLDEYVAENNPVRVIEAFVETLDLQALGFRHALLNETGRPPYHPAVLLKLYVYGYLNRIRSSRILEREAGRNVEVMWLTGKLTPDFKTIANFRRHNRKAIQELCRAFTGFCRDLDLFRRDLVAIDGSKFKAVNSRQRNFTDRKLQQALQDIDQKIEAYLDELDANDAQEPEERKLSAEELKEKIKQLKERMRKVKGLQQLLEESDPSQISLTDPDSRSMLIGGGRITDVGYNLQVAVDPKHKLIVDHEVTNAVTERGLLAKMALRAKQALGVERLDVLTDMGYYDGQQVKTFLEAGITPYIPKPNTSANIPLGLFGKEDFRYDRRNDCYRCPAGERLAFRWQSIEKGRERRYYTTPACARCTLKPRCTRDPGGRRISRWAYEDLLEDMQRRVRASPEKMKLRKQLVEHPFGTIKRAWNQGYFLTKGLDSVNTEMSLTVLAYNLKRVIQILGVPRMMEALA
ncbi:MAG: IS1182 family transposase [Anaerolineales bacterium]